MLSVPASCVAAVGKLIPRLASSADGEVLSTVRAIRRQLGRHGLDLHDLARAFEPPTIGPDDAARAHDLAACMAAADELCGREVDFIETLRRRVERTGALSLSRRQSDWLEAIARRIRREECYA